MKGIVVTKENYNFVASRLIKFFSHEKIVGWHQWNCGMKKRIGRSIKFNEYNSPKIDTTRSYKDIKIRWNHNAVGYDKYLCVDLDWDSTIGLTYGDSVWFLGNRIIIKSHLHTRDLGILYGCYQIDK